MTLRENMIIRSDGKVQRFHMPDVDEDRLEAFQTILKGFIEFVDIPENPELVAIVNEEGLLYSLPYNAMASHLLDRSIVGDCIIIKENQA